MYTYLATGLLSAALAFSSAWKIQNWRMDSHEKQAIEQRAAEERELSRMEQKRSSAVIAAQNVARTREAKLRADAAGARDSLDGLRASSAAALLAGRASHAACVERANAFDLVLTQCSAKYQELGATADRLNSDRQTLSDAWP